MKKIILLNILLITLYSCEFDTTKKQVRERTIQKDTLSNIIYINIDNGWQMDSLMNRALINGDKKIYNTLVVKHIIANRSEKVLYLALMMANKYNYKEAHFHVYKILNGYRTGENLENLDKKTKNFALSHLLKSYELGYDAAKDEVESVFKEKKIPQSAYYLNEFVRSDNADL